MSAAGPSQGARPLGGEARSDARGERTSAHRLAAFAWIAVATAVVPPLPAAEPPREMHGMADAFAAPGVTLAWGILRGANEAATLVVLRIVADPAEFPAIAATGTDPFTQRTIPLLVATPNSGKVDLRVSRAHFADYQIGRAHV